MSRGRVQRLAAATRSGQRGFSLIEVIAALLLLAITFTALMKVAGGAIGLTQRAAQRSEAAMWAHSLLDSAFVTEPVRPGTRSGAFDKRFHWQLQVTPWSASGKPSPNAALQLYQLDLDVMWQGGGHDYSAHFRTLRLASAPAGAAPGGVGP
ncbi:type IV pilus modification PilV family protein [Dyella sp.]|jgi:general secretion pathway protein I|uniref:type IV pilus modification PilV family protein n=1 Tax=Dyella sp. TaxID=1869338 RepID=UPI002D78DF8F|nr:prepilin-type N-terminal cleavage/methylation domain-containing protein [Dyella sp.]HET6431344.1 prepilin-type N-terminal cleavage/methylation domain-containing protein [Dyella sp.]